MCSINFYNFLSTHTLLYTLFNFVFMFISFMLMKFVYINFISSKSKVLHVN